LNTGSSQLVRQWLLLKMLGGRGKGQTVEQLAVELEVTDNYGNGFKSYWNNYWK
jgi:hypothetical protein